MDQRVSENETTEGRPDLRCDDGTLFIYSGNTKVYEPYERSNKQGDAAPHGGDKQLGRGFAEHWRKHWPIWLPVIVNILTLFLVGCYTYFAKQQVCAAIKQLKLSSNTMRLDERAWISVLQFPAKKNIDKRRVVITIENTGKTPALDYSVEAAFGAQTSEEKLIPGNGVVSPGGQFTIGVPADNKVSTPVYVHGIIKYSSIFDGHKHWTKFCYIRDSAGFSPCEIGNIIDTNEP